MDADGESCVTVHSNSTLNIPLRVLSQLVPQEELKLEDAKNPIDSHLASFVLSAEIRFPSNATVFTPIPINDAMPEKTNTKQKKSYGSAAASANQGDMDVSILTKLNSYTSNLSFADWMLPMVKRRTLQENLFMNMIAHTAEGSEGKPADVVPLTKKEKARRKEQNVATAQARTITLGANAMEWINETYFFMEETSAVAKGEGTLTSCADPSRKVSNVLITNERKGVPAKESFGLRILRSPQPPETAGDVLGLIMDNDCVVPTGISIMSEISKIAFEWIEISSPCAGWIVSRREDKQMAFVGKEEAEKVAEEGLPALTGVVEEAPSAPPQPVVPAEKSFMLFFDSLRSRALFEPNGSRLRIEHTRHPFEAGTAKLRKMEPLAALPPTVFSPSSKTELINDRERQLGKLVIKDESLHKTGELSGDVAALLSMIVQAKQLRKGCKVIRNPDQKSPADGAKALMDEIGTVQSVTDDMAKVKWQTGNTQSYAWGKNGIFELIKISEPKEKGEDADNDDASDTDSMDAGELSDRVLINNDEKHCEYLFQKFVCSHCYKLLTVPDWVRCNECDWANYCRRCAWKGMHGAEEHEMTEMSVIEDIANGSGDVEFAGIYVGARVTVKETVESPTFGWGEDLEQRLSAIPTKEPEQYDTYDPTRPFFHWPSTLAGFEGTVTSIDRAEKVVTVEIQNIDGSNFDLQVITEQHRHNFEMFEDTIVFKAHPSELQPHLFYKKAPEEDKVESEEEDPVFESPTSYTNLYRMMPHLYHLCSVFDSRIITPLECTATHEAYNEKKTVPPLRSRLSEMKVSTMRTQCPYLSRLADVAVSNLVVPFKNDDLVLRNKNLAVVTSATSEFVDQANQVRTEKAVALWQAEKAAVATRRAQKRALRMQKGHIATGEQVLDAPDSLEPEEEVKPGSSDDHKALYNVNRLPYNELINAQQPFHLIRWNIYTRDTQKGTANGDQPKALIKQPFKNGSVVRYKNYPTEERQLVYQHNKLLPEHFQTITGTVSSVNMIPLPGTNDKELTLYVRWNIKIDEQEIHSNALASDVEVVKAGNWYLRPSQSFHIKEGEHKTTLREVATDDLTYSLTPEEKMFYSPFANDGTIALSSAIATMLERGLHQGQQITTVFIRDDSYDVDLKTGEVRRMKPSKDLRALGIDEDLIDIPSMSREQRDKVSKLMGIIYRVPAEPFVSKEKPPSIDDGLQHVISMVVREGNDDTPPQCHFVVDGLVTPISFFGCLSQLRDKAMRTKLLNQAARVFFSSPISFFGCDLSIANNKGRLMEGQLCSAYNITLNYDISNGGANLLEDTVKQHKDILSATEWVCASCQHNNIRLAKRCAKCKRSRRAPVVGTAGDPSRYFKVGAANSLEAKAVRSRLQTRLKLLYQQELDLIDQAQELLAQRKSELKAKAREGKK